MLRTSYKGFHSLVIESVIQGFYLSQFMTYIEEEMKDPHWLRNKIEDAVELVIGQSKQLNTIRNQFP